MYFNWVLKMVGIKIRNMCTRRTKRVFKWHWLSNNLTYLSLPWVIWFTRYLTKFYQHWSSRFEMHSEHTVHPNWHTQDARHVYRLTVYFKLKVDFMLVQVTIISIKNKILSTWFILRNLVGMRLLRPPSQFQKCKNF